MIQPMPPSQKIKEPFLCSSFFVTTLAGVCIAAVMLLSLFVVFGSITGAGHWLMGDSLLVTDDGTFCETRAGEKVYRTVWIKNLTSSNIQLLGMSTGCTSCFLIDCLPSTIGPYKSIKCTVSVLTSIEEAGTTTNKSMIINYSPSGPPVVYTVAVTVK